MSLLSLMWVDSITVGNSTAKNVLRYLCTHNFAKPGFFFKNSTYCKALEISEKTLQRAFDYLETNKFINIERRYDEFGRQTTNALYLNIPDEFYTQYEQRIMGQSDKMSGQNVQPRQDDAPRVVKMTLPTRKNDAPYNNNNNNNINNKRENSLSLDNFLPDKNNTDFAARHGLDLKAELRSFKERHTKQKTQYEFEMWLKKALEYKQKNHKDEVRCTVPEYGPGHPQWELNHGKRGIMHGTKHAG